MEKKIQYIWYFPQAPSEVWECLSNKDLLSQWLMTTDFEPEIGYQFKFYTKPKIKLGFDGIIYCKVLELIPQHKIVYSWRGGPGDGTVSLDTTVTWLLMPEGEGTKVTLIHDGFRGIRNLVSYFIMDKGWKYRIKKRLEKYLQEHEAK